MLQKCVSRTRTKIHLSPTSETLAARLAACPTSCPACMPDIWPRALQMNGGDSPAAVARHRVYSRASSRTPEGATVQMPTGGACEPNALSVLSPHALCAPTSDPLLHGAPPRAHRRLPDKERARSIPPRQRRVAAGHSRCALNGRQRAHRPRLMPLHSVLTACTAFPCARCLTCAPVTLFWWADARTHVFAPAEPKDRSTTRC